MLFHAPRSRYIDPGRPPAAAGGLRSQYPDLVLGPRQPLDFGELQSADDRPTRCDCELVDHKSCTHRLGSLGYQPGPSKPELEVRLPSTNNAVLRALFCLT